MGKIRLVEFTDPAEYRIIEEDKDSSVPKSGKDTTSDVIDIAQADSISDLLHHIYHTKDTRFYCEINSLDSRHRTRQEKYPLHNEICLLNGFIEGICDIKTEETYTTKWSVRYVSDLWIKRDSDQLLRVIGFAKKARREAEQYIKMENLRYEEEEEE